MHVRGLFLFLYLGTFALPACKSSEAGNHEMVFWCSNNNQEIQLCVQLTKDWNQKNPANRIHMQPVPEGQSSEEVILAAVVGKTGHLCKHVAGKCGDVCKSACAYRT